MPNYRSMLGGRDVKYDTRLDVMSANPPLEIFRCLRSMCARRQMEPELFRLAAIGIASAFFHAPARILFFIERTWSQEVKMHRPAADLGLHGTPDTAHDWAHEYTSFAHLDRRFYLTAHTTPNS